MRTTSVSWNTFASICVHLRFESSLRITWGSHNLNIHVLCRNQQLESFMTNASTQIQNWQNSKQRRCGKRWKIYAVRTQRPTIGEIPQALDCQMMIREQASSVSIHPSYYTHLRGLTANFSFYLLQITWIKCAPTGTFWTKYSARKQI